MGSSLSTDGSSRKKVVMTSLLFMGLSHILYLKQYLKGALFAIIEIIFLAKSGWIFQKLYELIKLDTYYMTSRDTQAPTLEFRMIDGITALMLIVVFIIAYVISISSADSAYTDYCLDGRMKSNKESLMDTFGKAFPLFGVAPAVILIVFFVIVPLLFSMIAGFTNWSHLDGNTVSGDVTWVGFQNFVKLFGGNVVGNNSAGGGEWSTAFASVAIWTILWGALATATSYLGGTVLATLLYECKFKITPVFRAILILPYAIPSILTLKIWSFLLASNGAVNKTLNLLGIINENISWLTDNNNFGLVKTVCILINMWVGVPYFMLLITGQMTAISADIYEAAKIDGANGFQVFTNITLPMVLYQTVPLIIMSFTFNLNNFGAIYFLTGGGPANAKFTTTTFAGGTDILITWIYTMSTSNKNYCIASVLAMLIFIVLAPFAVFNFMNTKSFKEGEL